MPKPKTCRAGHPLTANRYTRSDGTYGCRLCRRKATRDGYYRAKGKETPTMPRLKMKHCPHGHEYDEANTYTHPKTGYRACRKCKAKRAKTTYHEVKRLRGYKGVYWTLPKPPE